MVNQTPLMQQYIQIKKDYPDALLLFQVGDFYELFFEDAKVASSFLGITLTSRNKHDDQAVAMCGVPVHALDHYLTKLIKGGYHVALCDQLELASPGKMVKRGITRVFTPATLTDERMLDPKSPSYLMTFYVQKESISLVVLELLTSNILYTDIAYDVKGFINELSHFFPDEIICYETYEHKELISILKQQGYPLSYIAYNNDENSDFSNWSCNLQSGENAICMQSLYILYKYLYKNQPTALQNIKTITYYHPQHYAILDDITLKNLEILKNNYDNSSNYTLFSVLDQAITPMGSRMIKKWLIHPLRNQAEIIQRQQVIQRLLDNISIHNQLKQIMQHIGDLERIVGRIALDKASIHDYILLTRSLKQLHQLNILLLQHQDIFFVALLLQVIPTFEQLIVRLDCALYDDGSSEWIIKPTYNDRLDQVRSLIEHSSQMLLDFEQQEQKRAGISSLKVRFNQMQGYYIEITKAHSDRVPADYIQSQSLVGRERFTSIALKRLEAEMSTAQEHAEALEKELFDALKHFVRDYISPLRMLVNSLAQLDALFGLSLVAYKQQYVCPQFNATNLHIIHGRHPIIEQSLDVAFITNDIVLNESDRMMIITGPNMGGKSTFMRQIALISIMAQCGSFVPAQSAQLPVFDQFFTRIGAGDYLAQGKSTFLVEMSETALICQKATAQSLIILDEVGRGTSTYDGMALAHAITVYIYEKIKAKTLFATHYHELAQLTTSYEGIKNFHAVSKKTENGILLLHKIIPGATDGSFGIEIAQQAQMPQEIIDHAQTILQDFAHDTKHEYVLDKQQIDASGHDLRIWYQFKTALKELDIENISPRQAFDLIWKWHKEI